MTKIKYYSHDLRTRIYSYSLEHSIRKTACLFGVSPNTVYWLKRRFIETGSLKPRQRPSNDPHLITPEGCLYLESLLSKEVDLTLEALRDRYEEAYGIRVSIGTMFNTMRRLNIMLKKDLFWPKKTDRWGHSKKEI